MISERFSSSTEPANPGGRSEAPLVALPLLFVKSPRVPLLIPATALSRLLARPNRALPCKEETKKNGLANLFQLLARRACGSGAELETNQGYANGDLRPESWG